MARGPQFGNIATFSRKKNKAGNSVAQVIAEAERDPDYSYHVDNPEPPEIIFGMTPSEFREEHDRHVAARKTQVDTKHGQVERAIRRDRDTMASMVLSYPKPWSAITTDEDRADYQRWVDANVKFLKDEWGGGQLKSVMAHSDEAHPHLHAWGLPDNDDADARMLHPGKSAKLDVENEWVGCDDFTPRERVKMGNDAYKNAMRAWQDRYHAKVGAKLGMTRLGPKRQRLSRKDWLHQKNQQEEIARQADAALNMIADAEAKVDAVNAKVAEVNVKATDLDTMDSELEAREAAVEAKAAELEAREAAVEAKAAEVEAKAAELDARDSNLESKINEVNSKIRQVKAKIDDVETAGIEAKAHAAKIITDAETEAGMIKAEYGATMTNTLTLIDHAEAEDYWYDPDVGEIQYADSATEDIVSNIRTDTPMAWDLTAPMVVMAGEADISLRSIFKSLKDAVKRAVSNTFGR